MPYQLDVKHCLISSQNALYSIDLSDKPHTSVYIIYIVQFKGYIFKKYLIFFSFYINSILIYNLCVCVSVCGCVSVCV